MALSDKEISALYFEALGSQHLREQDRKMVTRFAHAVESEVRKSDDALIRQLVEALEVATTPLAKDRQEVLRAVTAARARMVVPAAYQLQEGTYALYTAPQPVAREQLTDAQIAEMMRDTWGCASIAPRHALEFARVVERAHGIKGGQHGTE